jgi:hypothetical protein
VGASLKLCVSELSKLYDRALRSHPIVVGIATPDEAKELFPVCDRTILLTDTAFNSDFETQRARAGREIPISAPDAWDRVLESITVRR